jgi:hypothetical protein
MSLQETFMALVSSTFRLDSTDPAGMLRQFRFLERLTARVPVRRLRLPSSFEALPAGRDAILADLEQR